MQLNALYMKKWVNLIIWFLLPFFVVAAWHYFLFLFLLYRMLQGQLNLGNIMAFSENHLYYENRHLTLYFFFKGQPSEWKQEEKFIFLR